MIADGDHQLQQHLLHESGDGAVGKHTSRLMIARRQSLSSLTNDSKQHIMPLMSCCVCVWPLFMGKKKRIETHSASRRRLV